LILVCFVAVISSAQGQAWGLSPDIGEASSGSYGETSITYSSSGYYDDQSTFDQESWDSHNTVPTVPRKTATKVAQPQTIQPSTTSPAAQTFQAPKASGQQEALTYNILANQPIAVFYAQAVQPWQTFVSMFPKNMPMFWANTQAGWQWYATCPLGGWAQEIMFIPQTGSLGVYEVYPDRNTKYYDYGYATPGYHYIWFNGDTPGRHTLFITVDKIPSNSVAFDVI
jgi:hypothetical protein